MTTTVNVAITERGIETPLGPLTIQQVEKGQRVLEEIRSALEAVNIQL